MTTIANTIEDEQMEAISEGRGLTALLRPMLNEILEVELTDHFGVDPHERTDERTGQLNGHYTRELTTWVGTIELRAPRDREGNVDTDRFDQYQRSEKVLAATELGARTFARDSSVIAGSEK